MAGVRRELDRKQVSKDYEFDKPFLRSVRDLNQEIVATHQSKFGVFRAGSRETPGEDHSDLQIYCRDESTNNEVYSYDKHYKETR